MSKGCFTTLRHSLSLLEHPVFSVVSVNGVDKTRYRVITNRKKGKLKSCCYIMVYYTSLRFLRLSESFSPDSSERFQGCFKLNSFSQ